LNIEKILSESFVVFIFSIQNTRQKELKNFHLIFAKLKFSKYFDQHFQFFMTDYSKIDELP